MEEEIINGEQPLIEQITQEKTKENVGSDIQAQNVEKVVDNDELNGSLGKFKDAQSLLSAYNNLQAEFTKKCQSLSELRSKVEEDKAEEKTEIVPIYEKSDWTEKVSAFLAQNKQAQPFAKDIANLIMQDKELAKSDMALDVAFAKVVSQSFVAPSQVVEDDKFVNDYVLTSEKVKNAVLNLYLKELQNNKSPSVLNNRTRTAEVLYKVPTANTLGEAKDIVKQMFD